jgi:hypothetical protein
LSIAAKTAFSIRYSSATGPLQPLGDVKKQAQLRLYECCVFNFSKNKINPPLGVKTQPSEEKSKMQAMVSLWRHYAATTPPLWYHYAAARCSFREIKTSSVNGNLNFVISNVHCGECGFMDRWLKQPNTSSQNSVCKFPEAHRSRYAV